MTQAGMQNINDALNYFTCASHKKGYRLVAANELGINHIYVKENIAGDFLQPIDVSTTLKHPKTVNSFKDFEPIKDWEYIKTE